MSEKSDLLKFGIGGLLLMVMLVSGYMFVITAIGILKEVLISLFYLAGIILSFYGIKHIIRSS